MSSMVLTGATAMEDRPVRQQQPGVRQMIDALSRGDFIQSLTTAARSFPKTQVSSNASRGWKLQHIGFLSPNADVPFDSRYHVQMRTDVHYHNVCISTESVGEHATNPLRREAIVRDFSQLGLSGGHKV